MIPILPPNMPINPEMSLKDKGNWADNTNEERLQQACKNFEAIMLRQMLKIMRETVPKEGLFGNSYSQEMFQSMHDSALADQLAAGKGMGLGEVLYKQLTSNNNE